MGQFKHSVSIRCPKDKAFDYVSDWQNLKSFMSNIVDIKPVGFVQSGPGAAFNIVFKIAGAEIPVTLEVGQFVKGVRMMVKSREGLKMMGGWEFQGISDGAVISFSLQYELPPAIARSAQDQLLTEKDFDNAAAQSLQLLKWILESSTLRTDIIHGEFLEMKE